MSASRIGSIAVAFFLLAYCSSGPLADENTPANQSMPEVGKPLHCLIRGEATCKLGEAPKIQVALVNQTHEDILLVGSLDASDCKWRYPHCYFEVINPNGKSVPISTPRCGLTNPLRKQDFVEVPPDASFNPYKTVDDYGFFAAHQLRAQNFTQLGRYRIRFVYSTDQEDVIDWRGNGEDAELVSLLNQVPKTEVRSEEFVVTVKAPRE